MVSSGWAGPSLPPLGRAEPVPRLALVVGEGCGWKVIHMCKAMIIYLTGTAACGKECNLVILL